LIYFRLAITHRKSHWQKIISQLAATALYQMAMNQPDEKLSRSYSFIRSNAAALNKAHLDACLEVFAEAEELVELILGYP
jgi:hypothetical protein